VVLSPKYDDLSGLIQKIKEDKLKAANAARNRTSVLFDPQNDFLDMIKNKS